MPLSPQDVKDKLFTSVRFKQGYDEDEVDAFLDEVEAELTRLLDDLARLQSEHTSMSAALDTAHEEAAASAATRVPPPASFAPPTLPPSPAETTFAPAAFVPAPVEPAPPAPFVAPAAAVVPPAPVAPAPVPGAGLAVPASAAVEAPPLPSPSEEALRRVLILAQRTADEAISEARAEADRLVGEASERAENMARAAQADHEATMGRRQAEHDALVATLEELRSFERDYRSRLRAYLHLQLRDLEAAAPEPQDALGGAGRAALSAATPPAAPQPAAPVTPPVAMTPPPAAAPTPAPTATPQVDHYGVNSVTVDDDDYDGYDDEVPVTAPPSYAFAEPVSEAAAAPQSVWGLDTTYADDGWSPVQNSAGSSASSADSVHVEGS